MNGFKILVVLLFVSLMGHAQIDQIVGRWDTIDDSTGEKRSIVRIYKATDGLYYGKIEHLYDEQYNGALCLECEGTDYNKPVMGLIIVRGMHYEDGVLKGGKVLDPESGKSYHGKISYDTEKKELKLRGSIDKMGILGRSQYWTKN